MTEDYYFSGQNKEAISISLGTDEPSKANKKRLWNDTWLSWEGVGFIHLKNIYGVPFIWWINKQNNYVFSQVLGK